MGRLFGAEIMFTWRPQFKTFLQRMIKAEDNVVLHVYMYRPTENLLEDTYAKPWIKRLCICP